MPVAGPSPVHRAFVLLQLIVAAGEPVGVRELARRSELARSTVARLVGSLEEMGMVERTSDGKAFPGPALDTLNTTKVFSPSAVAQQLRPLLAEVAEQFGESAAVGFDSGEQFLYVAVERRIGAVQVPDPSGHGYPFHLVASGVVAMGFWPEERLRAYLATELTGATEYSVVDPSLISDRVAQVREQGWSWAVEELDLEVTGVAVPLITSAGECVAVVSVDGPAFRLNPEARPDVPHELATMVTERAAHLLGWGVSAP